MRLWKLHCASSYWGCVPSWLTSWQLLGSSLTKGHRLRLRGAAIGPLQVIHVYGIGLLLPLAWSSCWCCLLNLIVLISFAHELFLSSLSLVHGIWPCIVESQVPIVIICTQYIWIGLELPFDLSVCIMWSFLGSHLLVWLATSWLLSILQSQLVVGSKDAERLTLMVREVGGSILHHVHTVLQVVVIVLVGRFGAAFTTSWLKLCHCAGWVLVTYLG